MPKSQIVKDKTTAVDFSEALSSRYLSYAVSTIKSRSFPDLRDGLKPVHRRIIYAMLCLKLNPNSGYKKCARVVGDVVGKYHPHGDISVYDALVRMAQYFSSRYPLVEGQGNFGSIDGDSQAAMRYTEAKLTPYAMLLLAGIEDDMVNFVDNYDESEQEPEVLPSIVPNLLANGTEGIAVGMATSIPPHNLTELINAQIKLLQKKSTSMEELMEIIQGPDFPTGGTICESKESLYNTYNTGRGSIKLRARWHTEESSRGMYDIVITEIPFQTNKKLIIEKIAALILDKKLPMIETLYDDSADDIRLIIVPKSRNIKPEVIMETLFKLTDLQTKFAFNNNALTKEGTPRLLNLQEVLNLHLEHVRETNLRKLANRLTQIEKRIEILNGFATVYLNLDEVIRIIREEDDAKAELIKRFSLTDNQAEAVLNMRLRSLRKLEEIAIKDELAKLQAERAEKEELIADPAKLDRHIIANLKKILKEFPDQNLLARKTEVADEVEEVEITTKDFVEKEAITAALSTQGWVKTLKGHSLDAIKYKDGDKQHSIAECYTTDTIVFATNLGKFYSMECHKLSGGKGAGDPVKLLFDLAAEEEVIAMFIDDEKASYLLVSSDGKGFVATGEDLLSQTRKGKQIMNVDGKIIMQVCLQITPNHDMIAMLGENRRLVTFDLAEVPQMKRGKGVTLQKYKQGGVKSALLYNAEEGICWQKGKSNRTYCLENSRLYKASRGSLGKVVLTKLWVD